MLCTARCYGDPGVRRESGVYSQCYSFPDDFESAQDLGVPGIRLAARVVRVGDLSYRWRLSSRLRIGTALFSVANLEPPDFLVFDQSLGHRVPGRFPGSAVPDLAG